MKNNYFYKEIIFILIKNYYVRFQIACFVIAAKIQILIN